jgi:hypothetical protein
MGRGGLAKKRWKNDRIRKKKARDQRMRQQKAAERQSETAELVQ